MKTINFFLLGVFVLLLSCNNEEVLKDFKYEKFSISLPSYMIEIKGRNSDVIREFEVDSTKNLIYNLDFTIYRDEFAYSGSEKLSLKEYYKFVADDILGNNLESGSLNTADDIDINGHKAKIFEITGKYNDNGIIEDYYFVTGVIETSDYFYELTAWTPLEHKDRLNQTMKEIIKSFRYN